MSTHLKLAITTIGDLLLNNAITRDKDDKPISDMKLVIPNYQRPYKWTAKKAIQLLDDIVDAKNENKETYRLGTLILHQDQNKSKETYNIVDGQQRIITFTLLLKAINTDLNIDFLEQPLTGNPHNIRNIPNNYLALERRVSKFSDSREKSELCDYIKKNCELIVVITDDISEAFQFFDSQNARGKKLYPHDLLKAYHLREMNDLDVIETEKVVKNWEDLDQKELSALFSDYLYRVKEWTKGNKAWILTEHNIHKFKGITRQDNFPYAQFYKGAFAYADMLNHSSMPFVSGIRELKSFQLDTPIVAGKPFFDYARHYFEILKDIKNNDKYEGYFINDNKIVKTLDLRTYKNGVGNLITRLLFDTTILLYVDRFCPERPAKIDLEMLEQFVVFAFVWAYSLRAQYTNLSWQSAQNYIMGNDVKNSFNMYKTITESDSPVSLLSTLSDRVNPLSFNDIKAKKDNVNEQRDDGIYKNYLHFFKQYKFLEGKYEN
nr:DUF262 domain-containing protein [uncultured Tolumonas sp.]